MAKEVWVQLYVQGEGKIGRVFCIEIASLAKDRIDDLAKAVHQASSKSLGHCDAFQLEVYRAGTEFPPKEEDKLSPGILVPEGTTAENPLRVMAPAIGKNVSCFPRLFVFTIPTNLYKSSASIFGGSLQQQQQQHNTTVSC
jgi:hypothetical protein